MPRKATTALAALLVFDHHFRHGRLCLGRHSKDEAAERGSDDSDLLHCFPPSSLAIASNGLTHQPPGPITLHTNGAVSP